MVHRAEANVVLKCSSGLLCLSPEFYAIHQDRWLCHVEGQDLTTVNPIVLDPNHPSTKLLIQEYNAKLCHTVPERVFTELRHKVWILRGQEAVIGQQLSCTECCKWRSKASCEKVVEGPSVIYHFEMTALRIS